MQLVKRLWSEDAGAILSAEMVMVGTVGVLGAVAGLGAASDAVDGEFRELAASIRSFDQSYAVQGHRSCGAWKAGSIYIQQPVEKSIADLCGTTETDIAVLRERIERDQQRLRELQGNETGVTPEPTKPNDIETPKVKKKKKAKVKDSDAE